MNQSTIDTLNTIREQFLEAGEIEAHFFTKQDPKSIGDIFTIEIISLSTSNYDAEFVAQINTNTMEVTYPQIEVARPDLYEYWKAFYTTQEMCKVALFQLAYAVRYGLEHRVEHEDYGVQLTWEGGESIGSIDVEVEGQSYNVDYTGLVYLNDENWSTTVEGFEAVPHVDDGSAG